MQGFEPTFELPPTQQSAKQLRQLNEKKQAARDAAQKPLTAMASSLPPHFNERKNSLDTPSEGARLNPPPRDDNPDRLRYSVPRMPASPKPE